MLVNNTVKIVSLSALTLVLSACEPAVQPKVQPKLVIAERYADNGDGTVTDIQTNLTWQRCSVGQTWTGETCEGEAAAFKWDDAMALSKDGWRLPNVRELFSLVHCSSGEIGEKTTDIADGKPALMNGCLGKYDSPTINQLVFPNVSATMTFWSSSPYASNSNGAWYVGFYYGDVNSWVKDGDLRVRLVRAGQ